MKSDIKKQIAYRVLLSSPVIAFLVVTPLYILYDGKLQSFFEIWLKTLCTTLLWWGVQILIFNFLKKKNTPNWKIGICIVGLIFLLLIFTINLTSILSPGLVSLPYETLFLLRVILQFSINFIIFLLLDLMYSRQAKLRLVEEKNKLQFDNLQNKFKLLKAQINPHFLFNALNVSKSLIKSKPLEAEKYIVGLSAFLRSSLNNEKKSISLETELSHCKQYVDLQKVRFQNAILYKVEIGKHHLNMELPFFTMVTLIENAIKHNSFSIEEPLKILVWVEDNYLCIKNKIKLKNGVVSTFTGLSNLNERSQMFSGENILILNDGQNFTVKVKLVE